MLKNISNTLSTEEKNYIDEEIKLEEIQEALKQMKNKSCPGLDSISYALYKCFSVELLPLLREAFIVATAKKKSLTELTERHITLIYKKGELNNIANYRLITLLNCDYKLFTKSIMLKVNLLAPKLMGNTQYAFMNNRRATDNIMTTVLTLKLTKTAKIKGACTFLDFEKAYDRVNQNWIWRILKQMNFGEFFRNRIRNIYNAANSKIVINGKLSDTI